MLVWSRFTRPLAVPPAAPLPVRVPAVRMPPVWVMSPAVAFRVTVPLPPLTLPFRVMPLLLPADSRSTLLPVTEPV